jgi:competence protein ComEC
VTGPAAGRWTWLDLRLVPFALTVWTGSFAAPWVDPRFLLVAAVLAVAAGALLSRRPRRSSAVLVGVLAGLAVAGVGGGVRGLVREASPLRPLAEAGRSVTVVLELDGDPHRLQGAGPGRVVADATVSDLLVGERRHRVDDAVLLFAPAEGWAELLPGQRVRARVGAGLPRDGEPLVAVLAARGPPTPMGGPGPVQEAAAALRNGLAVSAGRMLDPRPAGLLPGLAVGDTGWRSATHVRWTRS